MSDEERLGWVTLLRQLMTHAPSDYAKAMQEFLALRSTFHEVLVAEFSMRLNHEMANRPQNTLQQKRDLASWVNKEARTLGLCVKGPKAGGATIVTASYRDDEERTARYQLVEQLPDGKRAYTNIGSLKDLRFGVAAVRTEGAARHIIG
jgi:hypothetical protein